MKRQSSEMLEAMDSAIDYACLTSRVAELERELARVREQYKHLQTIHKAIFYKWTKDDFVNMLRIRVENIEETQNVPDIVVEQLWDIWTKEFEEKWSSSECYDSMMLLIDELVENHKDIIFKDETRQKIDGENIVFN
jgi:hypothetical protein